MWTSLLPGANALAMKAVGTGAGVEDGEGVEEGVEEKVEEAVAVTVEVAISVVEAGAAATKKGRSERTAPVTFMMTGKVR
jgi:hypothetical protein